MPVSEIDSNLDTVGPYNRLSASQVNTYNSCKRMWFYEKVLKLKIKQIPVLYVGRAVEEAICRTFKESPSILLANASQDTLSKIPLDRDGKPSRAADITWPANRIIPLPDDKVPKSLEQLEAWAKKRMEAHLRTALMQARKDWERQERKSGDWSEINFDYCLEMCYNALKYHLNEVQNCFSNIDDSILSNWRSGAREHWPAPDGYGYTINGRHPLAKQGKVTILEAWEIARPWFVEPEAGQFSMNAIHPNHWFQGEYDLVYRWNGSIKIVDIKASKGIGDRSGDYVEQLRMYAMLWWTTHNKKEVVSELEIWYLGADVIKPIANPTVSEMIEMENHLEGLWHEIKSQKSSIEQYPAKPSPLRGFSEGGVSIDAPSDEKRCDRCDWVSFCAGGQGMEYREPESNYQLPGMATETKPVKFNKLTVRFNICANIDAINYRENDSPEVKIIQDGFRATIDFRVSLTESGEPNYPSGLRKNDVIYLENVIISSNYKGELIIKIDPFAKILANPNEIDYSDSLLNFRARWDIVGKLAYKFSRSGIGKNGREWHRKGLVIFDNEQSIKVSGWTNDWGHQYEMAKEGDYVLLSNIELDAWADQLRGQVGRNSRLDIVSD